MCGAAAVIAARAALHPFTRELHPWQGINVFTWNQGESGLGHCL